MGTAIDLLQHAGSRKCGSGKEKKVGSVLVPTLTGENLAPTNRCQSCGWQPERVTINHLDSHGETGLQEHWKTMWALVEAAILFDSSEQLPKRSDEGAPQSESQGHNGLSEVDDKVQARQ